MTLMSSAHWKSLRLFLIQMNCYLLLYNRLLKRKERFTAPAAVEKPVDPEMAEKLAKRAKRFESAAAAAV